MAYHHKDFWKCMDMKRDVEELNKMWVNDVAPWKCNEIKI